MGSLERAGRVLALTSALTLVVLAALLSPLAGLPTAQALPPTALPAKAAPADGAWVTAGAFTKIYDPSTPTEPCVSLAPLTWHDGPG